MLFFIRYKGKEHQVRVESKEKKIYVSFNGEKEELVDLQFYGNDVTFIEDYKLFSANIVGDKFDYTVWLPEGNLNLAVESEYRRIVTLLRGQHFDGENNVYAKMPGKIVKILVKDGDEVKAGDAVLVMEAMKMENEVRSTIAGRVARVCVPEGKAVETGTLLMELEVDAS